MTGSNEQPVYSAAVFLMMKASQAQLLWIFSTQPESRNQSSSLRDISQTLSAHPQTSFDCVSTWSDKTPISHCNKWL